tara:strand:+ start:626 stop:997 length:372 start_codon:yes stop_codon:yes gene_type:complete
MSKTFNFLDTPQITFNGYLSAMRNVYLTSSIGIALMTFSKNFYKDVKYVYTLSLIILLYSFSYGYKATSNLKLYLEFLSNQDDVPEIILIKIDNWNKYIYLAYAYGSITLILFLFLFYKKFLH